MLTTRAIEKDSIDLIVTSPPYNVDIKYNSNDDALSNAEAYNIRAKTHFRNNDFDKAIADFTKAIELNIQDAEAYYTRGK